MIEIQKTPPDKVMKALLVAMVVLLMTSTAWSQVERSVDPNLTVRALKPELTFDDFKIARARCIEKSHDLKIPDDMLDANDPLKSARWLLARFDNCMMAEGFEMIRSQPEPSRKP